MVWIDAIVWIAACGDYGSSTSGIGWDAGVGGRGGVCRCMSGDSRMHRCGDRVMASHESRGTDALRDAAA